MNNCPSSVLPIVDGPPEGYHGFAPDNHSLIRIDDFPDPRDLASFLRKLDNDDDAYKSYFRYKRAGPTHETMVGDAAKKDLFTGPILPPGDIDPVFRERWFNRTANFDRDWCGICRRSALAMHERQRLKEYKATEKSFFKRWFYADQSTDPFINRSSRTPKRIRVGYEQCLPGGKYLYLAVNSSVPEAGLELAQREWWNGFRASKDGGIVSMRKRPGFENSYVS